MNNKPSPAIAPDASGDRAPHSSRARRMAVLAGICLLAAVATTPLLLNQHPSGGDRMPSPDDSAKAAKEFAAEVFADLLPGVSNPVAVDWLANRGSYHERGGIEPALQFGAFSGPAPATASRRVAAETSDESLVDKFFAAAGALGMDWSGNVAEAGSGFLAGTVDSPANDDVTQTHGNVNGLATLPMLVASARYAVVPDAFNSSVQPFADDRKKIPLLRRAKAASVADLRPESESGATPRNQTVASSDTGPDEPTRKGTSSLFPSDDSQATSELLSAHTTLAVEWERSPGIVDGLVPGLDNGGVPAASGGTAVPVDSLVLVATTTGALPPLGTTGEQATQQATPLGVAPLPEPATLVLLALGLTAVGYSLRKR